MAISKKVALVTGSNQGIGFAIVEALCHCFEGDVVLTSRDKEKGQEAVARLQAKGLKPVFHQLDITCQDSIRNCEEFLREKYRGLDILVNNAGIAYKRDSNAPALEQARNTLKTNFWGTLNLCKALFPLLRNHARVVNVSSTCGCLRNIPNHAKREEFYTARSTMTLDHLESLMRRYESEVETSAEDPQAWAALGWGNSHYGISKAGVTAATAIMARDFPRQFPDKRDVLINCCCPGYVSTNMSSYKGPLSIEQGAITPVYLATLPPDDASNPNGQYCKEKHVAEW
ncbi:unnamed protein product [Gordionus sp. m RMFG-2023]|uniref:carbonyl reductase [NADPH] 3-like n=1 Tax=Gordionus sp. m RMFG-2023 TaxID=3053472 RepID=UPI0030DE474F